MRGDEQACFPEEANPSEKFKKIIVKVTVGTGKILKNPTLSTAIESLYAGSTYSMAVSMGQLFFWGQTKLSGEATMYPKMVQDLMGWKIRSVGCS